MRRFSYFFVALILFFSANCVQAEKIKNVGNSPVKNQSCNAQSPKFIDDLVGNFDHRIEIVFSDIDGTLLPLDKNAPEGESPVSVKQAVLKLKKAHLPLILATGRSGYEGMSISKRMGKDNNYVIALQGAIILNPKGKVIYEDGIDNENGIKVVKEMESCIKANNFKSKIFFYSKGKLYAFEDFDLPYSWEEKKVVKSLEELGSDFTLNKISLFDPSTSNLKILQAQLKKKFPNYHIDISADCYCDVSLFTSTKGNALKKLSEILKVDLKNSAVFGDAENDISMLELVKKSGGLAVAVGNAMDSVKRSANFVTSPVYEDGFLRAVDEILINNLTFEKSHALK